MANSANVVLVLGYVQNEYALAKNNVLKERYGEKRAFYSCNKTDIDHLSYIDKGSKEQITAPYFDDYVGYSGDNEKSAGVFNKDGLMNRKDKAELRKGIRATQSVIWHGIISFEEMFGKRYMPCFEDAYRLMKIELPRFLKGVGFDPDKIEWFAGLHENTRYRHIHYSFYEKEPSRFSERSGGEPVFSHGKISSFHFDRLKVRIEQRLTDISSEIKAARKDLTDLTKNLLFSPQSNVRYQTEIQERLDRLLTELPSDGRLSYVSDNMRHLKPQVNKIIDCLFKTNKQLYDKFSAFSRAANKKDLNTLQILKANKIKESDWDRYLVADTYLNDLYRRLGNQIINKVRAIKGKEKQTKNRMANKRIRRRTLQNLIACTFELNADFENSANIAFADFMRKLDEEKDKYIRENFEYEME